MKKALLLLTFGCFLLLGNQSAIAQNTSGNMTLTANSSIKTPKEKTNDVVNMLARTNKLDATQKEKIYEIFSSADKKIKGIHAIEDSNKKITKMAKMQDYINEKIKTVLNDEQYSIYSSNLPK
ncbi:hypothetical protein [Psychroserpens sp. Hel_I_66]|uniref:hypothetical protein n=1 Tax=Psychroserpens sp. Hel_I_66 TaxID=1250004 RepID=UPI0006488B71|nr:hypothetical protein [Psychroserpens sp. Hel_I_66]